jgi:DNA-binding beta-propeller fold protein YncE
MKATISIAMLIVAFAAGPEADEPPMVLVKSIALPHVEGRIDHLAFDAQTQRLYVAALGNNTVEVVDTRAGKWLRSLPGFHKPQGISVAAGAEAIVVANGEGNGVQLLNSDDSRPIAAVPLGDDSDNVRYDSAAKRVYVGYGDGAIATIDPSDRTVAGKVALAGHPESFQLERNGPRVFVNVPDANQIAVIDRVAMKVIATWRVSTAAANFPMALDEANHRLFIGCRRPAKLLVFDTSDGRQVSAFEIVGDTDDLFYDAARKRLYVSGGDGFVDVIEEQTPNGFERIAHVATAGGARTGLFVAEQNRFYLAVPHRGNQQAEIRVYDIH